MSYRATGSLWEAITSGAEAATEYVGQQASSAKQSVWSAGQQAQMQQGCGPGGGAWDATVGRCWCGSEKFFNSASGKCEDFCSSSTPSGKCKKGAGDRFKVMCEQNGGIYRPPSSGDAGMCKPSKWQLQRECADNQDRYGPAFAADCQRWAREGWASAGASGVGLAGTSMVKTSSGWIMVNESDDEYSDQAKMIIYGAVGLGALALLYVVFG